VASTSWKSPNQIRQGSIYWLCDCEPLDDDNTKDRPVIVVDDLKSLKPSELIVVIACSTRKRDSEPDAVQLPDRGTTPQTKSGLTKPCWAIPRWRVLVHRNRLIEYKGHLTGRVLKEVIAAHLARLQRSKK